MNRANAIKDKKDLQRMAEWLKHYSKKYYTIFLIALNSGLRISDVLGLNISDVKDKDYVEIHEQKTGKYKRFPLNKMVQNAIKDYLKDREQDYSIKEKEPLFIGKKHYRLDRIAVYRVLRNCAKALGIKGTISCHSTRKSFGYAHYKQYNDIGLLQTIFAHSSGAITLRYIDVTQEEIDKSYLGLDLGLAV